MLCISIPLSTSHLLLGAHGSDEAGNCVASVDACCIADADGLRKEKGATEMPQAAAMRCQRVRTATEDKGQEKLSITACLNETRAKEHARERERARKRERERFLRRRRRFSATPRAFPFLAPSWKTKEWKDTYGNTCSWYSKHRDSSSQVCRGQSSKVSNKAAAGVMSAHGACKRAEVGNRSSAHS